MKLKSESIQFLAMIFVSTVGLLHSTSAISAHWTAKVERVTAYSDGRAKIMVLTPYSPNPSDAVWGCPAGVFMASSTSSAPAGMLSVALTANAAKAAVRFDDEQCIASYITIYE